MAKKTLDKLLKILPSNVSPSDVSRHISNNRKRYITGATVVSYMAGSGGALVVFGTLYAFNSAYNLGRKAYYKVKRKKIEEQEISFLKGLSNSGINLGCSIIGVLNLGSIATSIDVFNIGTNIAREYVMPKDNSKNDTLDVHIVCDQNYARKHGEGWREDIERDSKAAFSALERYGVHARVADISQYHRDEKINSRNALRFVGELNNEVMPKKGLYVACVETNYYPWMSVPLGNMHVIEGHEEGNYSNPMKKAIKRSYGLFKKEKDAFKTKKPWLRNRYAKLGVLRRRR
ncbi:hypothetical protein KY345_05970 [Candidatus Woesearchaeota archaeon]|nr:hypothetical protein [Candidatus Woesearchaeota archaeon]